jgi:hypothetical protein
VKNCAVANIEKKSLQGRDTHWLVSDAVPQLSRVGLARDEMIGLFPTAFISGKHLNSILGFVYTNGDGNILLPTKVSKVPAFTPNVGRSVLENERGL